LNSLRLSFAAYPGAISDGQQGRLVGDNAGRCCPDRHRDWMRADYPCSFERIKMSDEAMESFIEARVNESSAQ